jgi:hypothetical protein
MTVPFSSRIRPSGSGIAKIFIGFGALVSPLPAETLYDFGNPTAEEQLYLEMVNRARANPPAEGARLAATTDPDVLGAYSYYNVNLAMMQSEFNAIAAQPPLAPNASLTAAARSHSDWMLANAVQSHNETNPSNTPWSRIKDAGYSYSNAGESVYAYCKSVWYGHAGFQVDWGPGTGGMQNGRGHRMNTHNGNFREIGVGVTIGSNGGVGPQLVTQDFGARSSSPSFGTGVAYYDLNGNNFYDIGEGISGLTVNVEGSSHYCETAIGGGWVVPVSSSAATRAVTFSGLGANHTANLVFPASKNAKLDLKLTYNPPAIASPTTAFNGLPYPLVFAEVAGATSYRWDRWSVTTAAPENCESTAGITTNTTGSYAVRNTSVKQEGTSSFHLETTTGVDQSFELNNLYFGNTAPSLTFQSSIRYATNTQKFKVQVKAEGTAHWQDVFSQNGTTSAGESSFHLRSANLASMAGKSFRVRFLLDHAGGYYTSSGSSVGWFIDAISFTNVSALAVTGTETLATTSGSFIPGPESCLMAITPVISGTDFPAAYQMLAVTDPPPAANPSFAGWAAVLELENLLLAGTLSDPSGDYDRDGKSNLIEYAFGGSPVSAADPPGSMPTAHTTATHLVLQYKRDTSLTDLTITPEACSTMGNWKAPGEAGAPAGFSDALISTTNAIETRQASVPLGPGNCFLRVRVSGQ